MGREKIIIVEKDPQLVASLQKVLEEAGHGPVVSCPDVPEALLRIEGRTSSLILPEPPTHYHGMIGESAAMKKIFDLIERIKESDVHVLITGPSGSGKEMAARAIHETSLRKAGKFVAINCSAIPETLLEGELFGYKKGAFTDARTDKIGLFQEADGGTIFLDEIGDMPLSLQPKILRVIQEKEIRPLGGLQSIQVDVRIIAA